MTTNALRRLGWLGLAGSMACLAACGASNTSTHPGLAVPVPHETPAPTGGGSGTPGFAVTLSSDHLALLQGGHGSIVVTIVASAAFADSVSVSVLGLPAGVSSGTLVLSSGHPQGTLDFVAAPNAAAPSPVPAKVRASDSTGSEVVSLAITVRGEPGALDRSFGVDGEHSRSFGAGSAEANAVAIAPDGTIYLAGDTDTADGPVALVAALDSDGASRADFGTDGAVFESFGGTYTFATSLTLRDDKLLIAGATARTFGDPQHIAVARFHSNGSLDGTFGAGGTVVTALSPTFDIAWAIANGTGGSTWVGGVDGHDGVLLRYLADGGLDTSFGAGTGVVRFVFGEETRVNRILPLDDGRVLALVAGHHPAIVRLGADGSYDSTFAGTGILALGSNLSPHGMCFDHGGLRVTGDSAAGLFVQRVLPDGTLDAAFGDLRVPGMSGGFCRRIDAAGGSFIAGSTATFPFRPALLHVDAGGKIDHAIGPGGVAVAKNAEGAGLSIAIDGDGRPIVAGRKRMDSGYSLAAWRFWP